MHISALQTYQHMDISSPWNFRHEDISAPGIFGTIDMGYFGTWTFRHVDILAPCKGIWTFWHRHFSTCATMPKCPCAEMSLCRNIHGAKKSLCQNVPVPKSPSTKKSTETKCPCAQTPTRPKRACAKMSQWWNVSGWNIKCLNGGKPS